MKRPSLLPCEQTPSHMIFEEDDNDEISCGNGIGPPTTESSKKRRLASEQVRALEQSFDVENRLEPDRKARLAQDLGLQPRQVAVWFQNRRARWKTKNLERDFSALKSRYDALRQDFESLRRDNQGLAAQLAALKCKRAEEKKQVAVGVEGGCDSDSSGVMNHDVFKVEGDWEETCGAEIFDDEYGSTLAWFSAEIAAGADCSGW